MRLSPTIFGVSLIVGTFFSSTALPCVFGEDTVRAPRSESTLRSEKPAEIDQTLPAHHPLLAQGLDAERRGDDEAAERCYRQFLDEASGNENDRSLVLPLHRLAVLHAKRKQFDASEQFFQRAVRLDNDNLALLGDFAQLQFDRKRYRDAEIILKYAFLLDPDNIRVLYNLGYSVGLQPDRQTEGLRYLKLALGEIKALRELAKIYRVLDENEQAEFAEQRAAQQEIRLKASGATTEQLPNLEARKELYEQIKRELIRAKSLEFAQELEKAGIRAIERFDADEQKKDAESAALRKISPTESLKADPLLSQTSLLPQVMSGPDESFDPWGVTSQPAQYVCPVLKTTPAASISPEPQPQPQAEMSRARPIPSTIDQRSRISNGPTAIPLPPVHENEVAKEKSLKTLPPFSDSASPAHYPKYAEIGVKPSPSPSPAPVQRSASQQTLQAASSQHPQGASRQINVSNERKTGTGETSTPPSPFDLVQPVNLVALEGHRERNAATTTAPTPEKIDEIAVRSLPMIAPDPADLPTGAPTLLQPNTPLSVPQTASSKKAPAPESVVRRTPSAPPRNNAPNNAPTPENVSPLALALAENVSGDKRTVAKEEPVGPKSWKEIDVEPYVYVENVPPKPSEQPTPVEKTKTFVAVYDPWTTQRPAAEPTAEFRGGNVLRETEAAQPAPAPEALLAVSKPEPKPTPEVKSTPKPTHEQTPEPKTEQRVAVAAKPVVEKPLAPAPQPVSEKKEEVRQIVQATPSPAPEKKEEPRSIVQTKPATAPEPVREIPRKEREIVKLVPVPVPVPMPTPSEPTPKESPWNEREIVRQPAPILEPPATPPSFTEPRIAEHRPIAPTPVVIPESVEVSKPITVSESIAQTPKRERVGFVRPIPAVTMPEPPAPVVAAPTPPPPPQREEESAGVAQTPTKVRIVNIVDLEPPPDNRPGFARSGNYVK